MSSCASSANSETSKRAKFIGKWGKQVREVNSLEDLVNATPLEEIGANSVKKSGGPYRFARPPGYGDRNIKVVSIFAQKGGVGKTSITGSLAWEVARRGKRVLVVDADPQSNLTEWLNPHFEDLVDGVEPYDSLQTYVDLYRANDYRNARGLNAIEIEIDDNDKTDGGALFLICGNNALSSAEFDLHTAVTTAASNPFQQSELLGLLIHGIRATGWAYDVDYILIDMNPSGGILNEMLVMTSDEFIIPANPSSFSVQCFRTTQIALFGDWKERYEQQVANINKTKPMLKLPLSMPRFQGVVVNHFRPARQAPAAAAAEFITRLRNVANVFKDNLLSLGFPAADNPLPREVLEEMGPAIPALDSHGQWSQFYNRPAAALKKRHLRAPEQPIKGDRLLEGAIVKVKKLKIIIRKIVNLLFPELTQRIPPIEDIPVDP